jgi:hypothetical protein
MKESDKAKFVKVLNWWKQKFREILCESSQSVLCHETPPVENYAWEDFLHGTRHAECDSSLGAWLAFYDEIIEVLSKKSDITSNL